MGSLFNPGIMGLVGHKASGFSRSFLVRINGWVWGGIWLHKSSIDMSGKAVVGEGLNSLYLIFMRLFHSLCFKSQLLYLNKFSVLKKREKTCTKHGLLAVLMWDGCLAIVSAALFLVVGIDSLSVSAAVDFAILLFEIMHCKVVDEIAWTSKALFLQQLYCRRINGDYWRILAAMVGLP